MNGGLAHAETPGDVADALAVQPGTAHGISQPRLDSLVFGCARHSRNAKAGGGGCRVVATWTVAPLPACPCPVGTGGSGQSIMVSSARHGQRCVYDRPVLDAPKENCQVAQFFR